MSLKAGTQPKSTDCTSTDGSFSLSVFYVNRKNEDKTYHRIPFLLQCSLRSKCFRGAKSEERGFRRFARAKNGARAKIRRKGWGGGKEGNACSQALSF